MDFITDKLNSVTGPALSRVNEYQKRRQEERRRQSNQFHQLQPIQNNDREIIPMAAGTPFGGDSLSGSDYRRPPPIGFMIMNPTHSTNNHGFDRKQQQAPIKQPQLNQDRTSSESSLYQADTWSRIWFPRLMLLSLIRLLIFIAKIYEDYHATKTYNGSMKHLGHFLIAASTLFLPTIVFTIYRVCRYLQVALPKQRLAANNRLEYPPAKKTDEPSVDESHLQKALISASPATPVPDQKPSSANQDDDGLVTARQTPTNFEEFQDSRSQPDLQEAIASEPTPSASFAKRQEITESVQVDKLGELPDKETVRVTIGFSEQLLHGVLFIFWQLKRQVDVLGYLVERSCLWRKPSERERDELEKLRTGSDGLEWFQDFYAAFLAILTQVFILVATWTSSGSYDASIAKANRVSNVQAALGSVSTLDAPDLSISGSARTLSDILSRQAAALKGDDALIMSQLLVSIASVGSLLIAVRRKDDGPLTLGLSMLGWGSIFSSRIVIITMAFAVLGWRFMLTMVGLHVLGIACWIYKISLDSFNDLPSERGDESKWSQRESDEPNAIEIAASESTATNANSQIQIQSNRLITSQWSSLEHLTLITQIFTLFALPSLFYWPIMFNLKNHQRHFKYLALIMSQNFVLMVAIWFDLSRNNGTTAAQWYLLSAVGTFSIMGFIFVSLYIACKPSLTEYFARADEIFNEAERSGIYFEFCSRIFKMPDLAVKSFQRLMNQTEEIIEEVKIDTEQLEDY